MTTSDQSLTSGTRLIRSVFWNVGGTVAPLLVGLIAIPLLIDDFGKERFGLLALIWMGVGYFSLFDMGLGRALTKTVAQRLGENDTEDLRSLIWTAIALITSLGLIAAVFVHIIAEPLLRNVFNVEASLYAEALSAFRLLAMGLPVVVLTSALVGILEAHQRFASIAAIRVPLGIVTFLGPLIAAQFSANLYWATGILLVARLSAAIAFFFSAARIRRELYHPELLNWSHARQLFRFGGWLTLTNIIGPIMVYMDRFLIGAIMSMAAVTYYVTPFEVVTRVMVLPQAIMAVIFPAMVTAMASDRIRSRQLYGQISKTLFLLMLPVCSVFFLFSPEILEIWVGTDFKTSSTTVMRWLALGVFVNSLAKPPVTLLQGAGRPELVAIAHTVELIPYVFILWWATKTWGVSGAALAWSIRVTFDMLILSELARRRAPEIRSVVFQGYRRTVASVAATFVFWEVEVFAYKVARLGVIAGYVAIQSRSVVVELLSSRRGR